MTRTALLRSRGYDEAVVAGHANGASPAVEVVTTDVVTTEEEAEPRVCRGCDTDLSDRHPAVQWCSNKCRRRHSPQSRTTKPAGVQIRPPEPTSPPTGLDVAGLVAQLVNGQRWTELVVRLDGLTVTFAVSPQA